MRDLYGSSKGDPDIDPYVEPYSSLKGSFMGSFTRCLKGFLKVVWGSRCRLSWHCWFL